MKKNKKEGYSLRSSKFLGSDECGYTYELTFNKSLESTLRFKGIEKGLDDFVRKEKRMRFLNSFSNVWYSFIGLFE